jgi:hypothetical protein
MTPSRLFFLSLLGLVVATCGVVGFFYIGFRYFTYQGSGLDWIYPVGGSFFVMWFGSAAMARVSGVWAVARYLQRARKKGETTV